MSTIWLDKEWRKLLFATFKKCLHEAVFVNNTNLAFCTKLTSKGFQNS